MRYGEVVRQRMFVQDKYEQMGNVLMGLGGEIGEILDIFKKVMFYPGWAEKNPNWKDDVRKEFGDVLWYVAAGVEILFGVSLLDIAKENIRKLQERYPEQYNDVNVDELTL